MTKSDEIMREVREEVERQQRSETMAEDTKDDLRRNFERAEKYGGKEESIMKAIVFLLGVVELGAELDEKRMEHIDRMNELIGWLDD